MRVEFSNILLFLRVIIGNVSAFVVQVLALSFLVALISGAVSLENALKNAFLFDNRSPYGYLYFEVFDEIHTLSSAWQLPAWVLIAVAVYVTSLHSVEELKHLCIILRGIGASTRRILAFMAARVILLGFLGWFLGFSIGLTFSQVVFRGLSYIFHGPYEVPVLTPSNLLQFALLTIMFVILGSIVFLTKILKTLPRDVLE